MQAVRRGERFDQETGLPESVLREQNSIRWVELACQFVDLKWPNAAAKTRTATADALATVTPAHVETTHGMPSAGTMRDALYGWLFHSDRRAKEKPSEEIAAAVDWLRQHSLKVAALDDPQRRSELIRRALDTIALRMDGKPAAATVVARKRAVFYGVLKYAVELDILPANPIDKVSWSAPKIAEHVDRRTRRSPNTSIAESSRVRTRCAHCWRRSSGRTRGWWRSSDVCTTPTFDRVRLSLSPKPPPSCRSPDGVFSS
ncbi:hypothetical protein [Actinopolymorpha alba]|uniref:hypothetical protein n=1 Tax=Actinopolymorpha alba TaxID=533267 RepID=UPI0003A6CDB5|nr:hypothetical protein [Actinopolymorpha alba]